MTLNEGLMRNLWTYEHPMTSEVRYEMILSEISHTLIYDSPFFGKKACIEQVKNEYNQGVE